MSRLRRTAGRRRCGCATRGRSRLPGARGRGVPAASRHPRRCAASSREAVEDAGADGVAYLELRFGPATHATGRMSIGEVIGAACEGLREGTRRSGTPAGLVACALRHHDGETNEAVARAAAANAGRGVVGFDVAGDELLFPSLEPMERPFAIAAAAGLGLTAHAAEAGPRCTCGRRSSGSASGASATGSAPSTRTRSWQWAAGEGICFEQCPTSNVLTGAAPPTSSTRFVPSWQRAAPSSSETTTRRRPGRRCRTELD